MNWFIYDRGLRHEGVKKHFSNHAAVEEQHILLTPNKEHKKVFPNVLVIGFRNGKSLKDFLVRATLTILNENGRCEPCRKKNLFGLRLYKYCYDLYNRSLLGNLT